MSNTQDEAASAAAAQETTGANGKPDGELAAKGGESKGEAQGTNESGDGLEKSYKELQGKFSKTTEAAKAAKAELAKLDKYGGVDKLIDQVENLLTDAEFVEWAKQRQQKTDYGVNLNETDAETKSALELVEKVSETTTSRIVKKEMEALRKEILDKINPVNTEFQADRMDKLLDGLDDKYGELWHGVRDKMADMIEADSSFPTMPSAKDVEAVLIKTLIAEGKMNEFGEGLYKRGLEKKKELATETPGTRTDSTSETQPKTIKEAYEMAKRQHA
jgi:hypothetical protein